MSYVENPIRRQDKVREAFACFDRAGFMVFPESMAIYRHLAQRLQGKRVIEYGCGIGLGAALMERAGADILATDCEAKTIAFVSLTYPWIDTAVADIRRPLDGFDAAVAVEVVEHVGEFGEFARSAPEVWFSSPNRLNPGLGQQRPHNDYHVREFTPQEVLAIAPNAEIMDWETFEPLPANTERTPLVYRCVS